METFASNKENSLLDCSIKFEAWGGKRSSTDMEGLMVGSDASMEYHHLDESNYYPWVQPYCNHYYYPEDKTKQAFKIVKVLIKKKMVKLDKVKDFVDLIDAVLEIL